MSGSCSLTSCFQNKFHRGQKRGRFPPATFLNGYELFLDMSSNRSLAEADVKKFINIYNEKKNDFNFKVGGFRPLRSTVHKTTSYNIIIIFLKKTTILKG